jgi:pyruvate,orthophosphate dikinase
MRRARGALIDVRTVYSFDDPPDLDPDALRRLLGGKGAGLAMMTAHLGLPVPPGFTLPTTLCRALGGASAWPTDLERELRDAVRTLEQRLDRGFGDPVAPLFVSVRSGAARSMPGMLETVLNVGATPATTVALARRDEEFAWQSYGRFLRMFGSTVLGCTDLASADPRSASEVAAVLRAKLLERVSAQVLDDPWEQLRRCIGAVFRSWDEPKAVAYRRHSGDSDELGTAVNIQAMVFGNADQRSGSGVYFTRDPNTGEARPYGDYLTCAQGEDVVAGTHHPVSITALEQAMPAAYRELLRAGHILECHLRDMCDIEFTIERGRLWLLQVRPGKRSAVAVVRIALDMAEEPAVRLGADEVLARVTDAIAGVRAASQSLNGGQSPLAQGLPASPGVASGRAYFSADDAVAAAERGESVVFVATATSPADVHAFAVAAGIVTATGGLVSHAALVAREWGLPAVVGAAEIEVGASACRVGAVTVRQGEPLTIDGTRGFVYRGELAAAHSDDEALLDRFAAWCRSNGQLPPG